MFQIISSSEDKFCLGSKITVTQPAAPLSGGTVHKNVRRIGKEAFLCRLIDFFQHRIFWNLHFIWNLPVFVFHQFHTADPAFSIHYNF